MATLSINALQKEILEQEVWAFLKGLIEPDAQARYAALLQQVEDEEIAEELSGALEGILEIVVESGRARKLYGPIGENSLTSLFQKTPKGSALSPMTTQVNQALGGLQGRIRRSAFVPRDPGPGH